jgi:hypothetical protein
MDEFKRKYCDKSLNWFDIDNRWRLLCIYIIENKWFDRTIIFLILTNSLMLSFYNYLADW